jgi:dolichol-phosphate mannosyltransferase
MTRFLQSPIPMTTDILLPTPEGELSVPSLPGGQSRIKLSVVIPTYNESENILLVVQKLDGALRGCGLGSYEIIIVDDDSPDGTWKTAIDVARVTPNVFVVRRTTARGLATAVVRGWQSARGEYLAVIDGDLQHPPEVIVQLWRRLELGADLAVASRHVPGGGTSDWGLLRRAVSRAAQLIGLLILPDVVGRVSDPMSGYFVVRRSRVENIALKPVGYKILIEVLARCSIGRVSEVGYVFIERSTGASKATMRVYWEYLAHLMQLRIASFKRG